MGSYAPRSPDFSAYQSAPAQPSQSQPYGSDSFVQPSSYYSSIPQPSYYPQQTLQVPQQGRQQPVHGFNDDGPPSHVGFSYTKNDGFHASAAIKEEDSAWSQPHQKDASNNAYAMPATGRGRGSGASTLKTEQSAATRIKNEPRIPAPGEEEGIEVKTKFPVARIKRIVQADEDVGKVAQVTPVVISKALELFMISITLSAAEEAKARGSKRVSGHHLKQVVQKAEQFDFLRDIVARIPDAPTSKEGKSKGDDSDDGEFEEKEKKPRKGRPSGSGGKRRKRTEREES